MILQFQCQGRAVFDYSRGREHDVSCHELDSMSSEPVVVADAGIVVVRVRVVRVEGGCKVGLVGEMESDPPAIIECAKNSVRREASRSRSGEIVLSHSDYAFHTFSSHLWRLGVRLQNQLASMKSYT